MLQQPPRRNLLHQADHRLLQNQPTSTADATAEDMAGDADEPPDGQWPNTKAVSSPNPPSQFQKSTYPSRKKSLLTQLIHTSDSDSHVDEDDYAFFEPNRTQSSASTYSRSSAVSMADLTSSTGHTSPHTNSPSPPPSSMRLHGMAPMFNQNLFHVPSTNKASKVDSVAPTQKVTDEEYEQAVQLGLGRKRCITFACSSKDTVKSELPKCSDSAVELKVEPPRRNCSLKFFCPSRNDAAINSTKPRARLASPPPPIKRSELPPAQAKHRGSDSTLRNNSPKAVRKLSPVTYRPRRDSLDSDVSRSEATRFHEFASSEEEVDDWTKESGCYQRPITIDDTLAMENDLRKIGREVEEEDENENDEDDSEDEDDQDEDDEDDEDDDSEDEDAAIGRLTHSGYVSDEGFRTDDEEGFAQSDEDSDGDSDYDWWAPGRSALRENIEHIRPSSRPRRHSESSTESDHNGIPISPHLQRKRSRLMKLNDKNPPPELPDSTDFVCGTLDEDKPLEHAYMIHLEQRRAAKHKAVPQDIDPTFPASDPEIDEEEEDEVSDHDQTESDHPMFFHGPEDLHDGERRSHRLAPSKRSPIPSPRRLRSPPPTKRVTLHRSPPPPARRARSPAPFLCHRQRLSSSVPRRGSQITMRQRFEQDTIDEDLDDTPRFNRRAVDIVMGLAKKRERRREKMHEKLYRKAAKKGDKKPIQKGKGAERMRDLGIGLNEYRGRKTTIIPPPNENGEVHMLSY